MSIRDAIRKVRQVSGQKVGPVKRDAFLYMDPKTPKDTFAQCGTCMMFTGDRCTILGPDVKVTAKDACGLYVHGKNASKDAATVKAVSTEEAGFIKNTQTRCENCKFFETKGGSHCDLFEMLNEKMPEEFDLEEEVHPKGCCNAFTA